MRGNLQFVMTRVPRTPIIIISHQSSAADHKIPSLFGKARGETKPAVLDLQNHR
jgi:hypothetical protein